MMTDKKLRSDHSNRILMSCEIEYFSFSRADFYVVVCCCHYFKLDTSKILCVEARTPLDNLLKFK